ncbi:MAG TPA: glycosyltransferase family 1 protein [Burkholderiaceae bacterium]|nr:glycosyltransferase family 1 protein [Burkholderiaceae bacterium]
MRVALNATPLLSPLTGIGQYTYQIAKGLYESSEIKPSYFYAGVWSDQVREADTNIGSMGATQQSIRSVIKKAIPDGVRYRMSRAWRQRSFSKGCQANQIQVYHEPNFLTYRHDVPTVLTVHDLSWIRYPHTHAKAHVAEMNHYFPDSLMRADKIVTVSEFVKQEVQDVFGIAPDRIVAIGEGAEQLFQPRNSIETQNALNRFGLKHGKYILAVGTLEPRKNLIVALKAYSQLSSSVRAEYPLILIGMKAWLAHEFDKNLASVASLIKDGQIRLLGYQPREDLAVVMSGALCLVYPSIYEGFGLPPLEAMASAVPVISSNVSSIPEVVGDSGVLIDPHNVEALTEAMLRMVEDANYRNQLSQKALERSRVFSWPNCVEKTIAVYREVLNPVSGATT